MLYNIARFLQLAGLIVVPFGIMGNVMEKLDLRQSLIVSGIGVGVFFVGWLLQQMSRPE
jgi:hypothetical protein